MTEEQHEILCKCLLAGLIASGHDHYNKESIVKKAKDIYEKIAHEDRDSDG